MSRIDTQTDIRYRIEVIRRQDGKRIMTHCDKYSNWKSMRNFLEKYLPFYQISILEETTCNFLSWNEFKKELRVNSI